MTEGEYGYVQICSKGHVCVARLGYEV
jgi:hypothetical protein